MPLLLLPLGLAAAWAAPQAPRAPAGPAAPERHLTNIRQLTFGGENAEAYFSPDGARLIFQSTREGVPCDQMFTMKIDGSDLKRVSTGSGRTTCGYFTPDGKQVVYASTHETARECPPRPSFSRGYVWPVYVGYDIYRADADGSALTPLTRISSSIIFSPATAQPGRVGRFGRASVAVEVNGMGKAASRTSDVSRSLRSQS